MCGLITTIPIKHYLKNRHLQSLSATLNLTEVSLTKFNIWESIWNFMKRFPRNLLLMWIAHLGNCLSDYTLDSQNKLVWAREFIIKKSPVMDGQCLRSHEQFIRETALSASLTIWRVPYRCRSFTCFQFNLAEDCVMRGRTVETCSWNVEVGGENAIWLGADGWLGGLSASKGVSCPSERIPKGSLLYSKSMKIKAQRKDE